MNMTTLLRTRLFNGAAITFLTMLWSSAPAMADPVANAAADQPKASGLNLQPLAAEPRRPLMPEKFCWVAGVDRTARGVAIHLTERRRVIVLPPDDARSEQTFDPQLLPNMRAPGVDGAVMHLDVGATFSMVDAPDKACTGVVMRKKDGRVGVDLRAVDAARPQPKSNAFLYAQPVNAVIKEKHDKRYDFFASWPQEAEAIAPLKREFHYLSGVNQKQIGRLSKAGDSGKLVMFETTSRAGDNAHFLSLLTEAYQFLGGAHGESGYQARLWDRQTRTQITGMTTLFTDGMAGLRPAWCAALDTQRVIKSEGRWKPEAGKKYEGMWECPQFSQLAVSFVGAPGEPFDRIRILAAPYLAGPYADGDFDVRFPVTQEVLALVKPQYRDAFKVYATQH